MKKLNKRIITITGIRPDFIRMSKIFQKLDLNFEHILIHTGQHFDEKLSDIFFKEMKIRQPDYNWGIGGPGIDHFDQLAATTLKVKEYKDLIFSADLVMFLGDSNSALAAVPIKKLGVKVGHIEAGMRSGDKRMFEEINRITCDHCSDFLFVYHDNYAKNLAKEGITKNVFVVGNTITEVVKEVIPTEPKENKHILIDIHRPENFLYKNRLENIILYANDFVKYYNLPAYLLMFPRTMDKIKEYGIDLGKIEPIPLMGFKDYISSAYHSQLVISDSGTAQEELAFLKTPVWVPRSYTERWESVEGGCSSMVYVEEYYPGLAEHSAQSFKDWAFDTTWLGEGNTSDLIIKALRENL